MLARLLRSLDQLNLRVDGASAAHSRLLADNNSNPLAAVGTVVLESPHW